MSSQTQINAPRTQFIDPNGIPLAGGSVATYVPGTFTPVTTYSDAGSGTQNTNPSTLDSLGSVSLWADGLVRMIVKDALGNQIYDQIGGGQNVKAVGTLYLSSLGMPLVNAATNTAALTAAIAAVTTPASAQYGKQIVVDSSGAFPLNKLTITALAGGGRPVEISFGPWVNNVVPTAIAPATTMDYLIDCQASQVSIDGLTIYDTDVLTAGGVRFSAPPGASYPCRLTNSIFGAFVGTTAPLCVIDGANNVTVDGAFVQNAYGVCRVIKGGVNSIVQNVLTLGTKRDILLDFDGTAGYSHAENFSIINCTFQSRQADSRSIDIQDALDVRIINTAGVQQGANGTGLYIKPVTGKAVALVTVDNSSYFEGSDNGAGGIGAPAIDIKGGNAGGYGVVQQIKLNCRFGQGGYAAALVRGLVTDNVNDLVLDGMTAFFPIDLSYRTWEITNCANVYIAATCTQFDRGLNLPIDTGTSGICEVGVGAIPAAANRSLNMQYPWAEWSTYTPTILPTTGAFGAGQVVVGRYRKQGRTADLYIYISTPNPTAAGTAAGVVQFSCPSGCRPVTSATWRPAVSGAEPVLSGKGVAGSMDSGTLAGAAYPGQGFLRLSDAGFCCPSGSIVYAQARYETLT